MRCLQQGLSVEVNPAFVTCHLRCWVSSAAQDCGDHLCKARQARFINAQHYIRKGLVYILIATIGDFDSCPPEYVAV